MLHGSTACGHEKSGEKGARVGELSAPCVNVTRMHNWSWLSCYPHICLNETEGEMLQTMGVNQKELHVFMDPRLRNKHTE